MSNIVTIPLENIEVQLINPQVTTPAIVHFRKDGVEVRIETENDYAQVRLELRGDKVVAVLRGTEFQGPRVITLFSFNGGYDTNALPSENNQIPPRAPGRV